MKNAVMQTWSSIKSDRSPPSMNELIEGILKQSKDKGKNGDFFAEQQDKEIKEKKMAKKKERDEERREKKELEGKDSYLTANQFEFIYKRIQQSRRSLKDQQDVIDKMEHKMLKIIDNRNTKEEREQTKRGDDKEI